MKDALAKSITAGIHAFTALHTETIVMSSGQSKTVFSKQIEVATFGGGCFWGMEAIFSELKGVEKVESGYSDGTLADPTYEQGS